MITLGVEGVANSVNYIVIGTEQTPEQVIGDVDNDGKCGISDIVLLQKWLLAVPDTRLPNWKAADMNSDGKLNVFDLCIMKRMLK